MALDHGEVTAATNAARRWVDGTGYGSFVTNAQLAQGCVAIVQAIEEWRATQKTKPAKAKAGDD